MTSADLLRTLAEAAVYLRAEADFNRSWTDGRRNPGASATGYKARRLELAEQRERWAAAIAEAAALIEAKP